MSRPGIALVLALVVLLLVDVMTAGILTLTTHARLVSASHARELRAQAAAQLAAESVLAGWEAEGFDTLRMGARVVSASGSGATADLVYGATVERLLSGTYLIRTDARVGGVRAFATARVVALARTLDGAAVMHHSNGAIISGGPAILAGTSRVDAGVDLLPPAWSDSLCPPADPLPPPSGLRTARPPLIAESVFLSQAPVLDTALVFDSVAIGGVKWSEVESIADRIESGTVRPLPAIAGERCVLAAPANWGDPLHPTDACGGHFPMIVAKGDLIVSGGSGQGLLVVAGVLTLSEGAVFVGVIVARDGISLEPGTRVYGSVESRRGYALFDGTSVSYSRCAIARSLSNTTSAHRLVLQQQRFIRAF